MLNGKKDVTLILHSLAGLLYEETKNKTYRDLAGQTVAFMGGLNWDCERRCFHTLHLC